MKRKRSKYKLPYFLVVATALTLGAFYVYSRISVPKIDFTVSTLTNEVMVGEPFDVRVNIKNYFKDPLENVRLEVEVPDDIAISSNSSGGVNRFNLDDIREGGEREEILKFIMLPGAQEERRLNFLVTYSIGNLSATFEIKEELVLSAAPMPIDFGIEAPGQVVANENFNIRVAYRYAGLEEAHGFRLKLDYPEVLTIKSSTLEPSDAAKTTWELGPLKSGEEGEIALTGSMDLPEGSEFKLSAGLFLRVLGADYPILFKEVPFRISPSPLSLGVAANEGSEGPFKVGETVSYKLLYQNNTDTQFKNVSVRAKLVGDMYDFDTITADNATFSKSTNTIAWDYLRDDRLRALDPGAFGEMGFSIKIKSVFPIKRLNDKNFVVRAEAKIESPTVTASSTNSKTTTTAVLEHKIAGQTTVDAKAFFRDAQSLILNSGSLPPKAGSPLDVTVHWVLTNFGTDVTGVEIRAKLGEGVAFTGVGKSTMGEVPTFDKATDEMVWRVPRVFATTGVTGEPAEAIFQLKILPLEKFVDNYMPVLGATVLKAQDSFTGVELTDGDDPLDTRLADDPTVKEGEGKVIR